MLHPSFIWFVLVLLAVPASAQLNLNRYNGLPSNHVYTFLKDRQGYLWLATDQGVAKYNGYTVKLFNTSNGLGNNDVWKIYLDKKDRIWVLGYSNVLGYISKDRYHRVLEKEELIKPWNEVYESDSGLLIMGSISGNEPFPAQQGRVLYSESYTGYAQAPWFSHALVNGDTVRQTRFNKYHFVKGKTCICPPGMIPPAMYDWRMKHFGSRELFYVRKRNRLVSFDMATCTCEAFKGDTDHGGFSEIVLPQENSDADGKLLYMVYKKRIDRLDAAMHVSASFPVEAITRPGVSGNEIVFVFEDSLWGLCAASESHGAFINNNIPDAFRPYRGWDANGFSLVGALGGKGYWWNANTRSLAIVSAGKQPLLKKYNHLPMISQVLPGQLAEHVVLISDGYYPLNSATGAIAPQFLNTHNTTLPGQAAYYARTNHGIELLMFKNNSSTTKELLKGRFNGITYDSLNQKLWVYNEYSLYFIHTDNNAISMSNLLRDLHIKLLEKLLVDRWGNLVLKTSEGMMVYYPATGQTQVLLPSCNLAGAQVKMDAGRLLVAGRFGVAFITIRNGRYEAPLLQHHVKDAHYAFVNDVQAFDDSVLLHTDRGMYVVDAPKQRNAHAAEALPYLLRVHYNDNIYAAGSEVQLMQENRLLQLDLIRPSGNGLPGYSYRLNGFDTAWHESNAGSLQLGELEAGQRYTLSVMVKDNVWQSRAISVPLYVVPHWWQAMPGLLLVWLLALAGGAVVILVTVAITRRIIARKNARREQLLELELKSVYSQINPHFIFNTLNGALHFIRKQRLDEAYDHVFRFSQLLRAYLDASRQRYIPLSDEILNLRNYIALQQTRFAQQFTYHISLHQIADPGKISIPSLLLQPIVENAINHGLLPMDAGGLLDIAFAFDAQQNRLTCTVRDNGIGRERSRQQQRESGVEKNSYGDELVRSLIRSFNRYEKTDIQIAYEDLPAPHTGTVVRLVINNPATTL